MWEEVLRLAVGNGLWAVLFCALLIYQLKDGKRREGKYQDTISLLGERLSVINDVKEKSIDIKEDTELLKLESNAIKELVVSSRESV